MVSPYLWSRGIRRIDVMVATHAHEDHSAGSARCSKISARGSCGWGRIRSIALLDRAAQSARSGDREARRVAPSIFRAQSIEILSPPEDYAVAKPGNNDSLAFRIVYGARSFLLTGDMERPMELRVLSSGEPARYRRAQGGPSRIANLDHRSRFWMRFRHPSRSFPPDTRIPSGIRTRDVLARLAARHSTVFRTDLDGLVTVRTDGQRLWSDTMVWRGHQHGGEASADSIGRLANDW